jgi:hypothetical protein
MWNDTQPPKPISQRTYARIGQTTRWKHPCCPHCGAVLIAQVNGITQHEDESWYADDVSLMCSDGECQAEIHPNDTQDTWQPIFTAITRALNRRYFYG